jgi:hypothetical protein
VSGGFPVAERLRQTIVRLESPLCFVAAPEALNRPALDAWHRLVTLIQSLQASANNWTVERLSTPDQLLPYVHEEAEEVFSTIASIPPLSVPGSPVFLPLDTVMAQLLWAVARSSYPVMRLIEGVSGRYWTDASSSPCRGMLRLLVLLEPVEAIAAVDLVTWRAPVTWLRNEAVVEFKSNAWRVGDLLADLQQTLAAATPTIQPYLEGLTVKVLSPTREWRSFPFRLRLALEFGADAAEARVLDRAPLPDSALTERWVRLNQPTCCPLEHPALRQHLAWLQQLETLTQVDAMLLSDQALLPIVTVAMAAATHLTYWQAGTFGESTAVVEELLPKLLWHLVQGSYEIMRLLGGISAQVLEPQAGWQTGLLRLVGLVKLVAPDHDATFDLAQGTIAATRLGLLPPDAVVQSWEIPSCQQPLPAASLITNLIQVLQVQTPSIAQMLAGMRVECRVGEQWQRGELQFQLGLALTPSPC